MGKSRLIKSANNNLAVTLEILADMKSDLVSKRKSVNARRKAKYSKSIKTVNLAISATKIAKSAVRKVPRRVA